MTDTIPAAPRPVLRSAYAPAAFTVEHVELTFSLEPRDTRVRSRLQVRRRGDPAAPLVLHGEELELLSLSLDGRPLAPGTWSLDPERLTIPAVPDAFTLESEVRIVPAANSSLSGLYTSGGSFCTQCEAEGFRRITYFPDRPDVMARYTVTIEADRARYPVLLANGNRVAVDELPGGRRRARWEDPFPKPSYLFALVAGDLACHAGTFRTQSGRDVRLEIWVEPRNADKCEHALRSLREAMRWDEVRFGREYDLDLYMIVAVSDFNFGAMENKGLNIFNSKYVLARPETATDDDYESIQGVIAHEYFHNWTGNRVTCRDWFQLTLKEGLTVYRDQEFSAEMNSAAVKRVADVGGLRVRQFPEDAGPMAHPIRPESYLEMNNFYTATVYEKGAEVVRMLATLLGREGFRRGMDLYFRRHDGQAVTCDDFRAAMADANGRDLGQFERWYSQAGTPLLGAAGAWDEASGRYALTLRQACPAGQDAGRWRPLHIPVRVGLVGPDGQDLPLALEGGQGAPRERVLELTTSEATFVFTGIRRRPVPSLLRGYSAPVILQIERTTAELAFLFAHDSDPFCRWDAGQSLFSGAILELAEAARDGEPGLDRAVVEAFRAVLVDPRLDGSMRAVSLGLPPERELVLRMVRPDPDALHRARELVLERIAVALRDELRAVHEAARPRGPYSAERAEVDRRRTRNLALGYLVASGAPEAVALALEQLEGADNMTDAEAALAALAQVAGTERERAFARFYQRWASDPLVVDKWFALQAKCALPGAPTRVRELASHQAFAAANPNRIRALVLAFALDNVPGFHDPSGEGYAFVADHVLEVDPRNPQLASRLAAAFLPWRRFDSSRQDAMQRELERIVARAGLSKNTFEIVRKALDAPPQGRESAR